MQPFAPPGGARVFLTGALIVAGLHLYNPPRDLRLGYLSPLMFELQHKGGGAGPRLRTVRNE